MQGLVMPLISCHTQTHAHKHIHEQTNHHIQTHTVAKPCEQCENS